MSYPFLVTGALLAAIAGSSASAATYNHNLRLLYNGTTFDDVLIIADDDTEFYFDELGPGENIYGIPEPIPGLTIGDIVTFRASLVRPPDADDDKLGTGEGNGGYANSCFIGSFSCLPVDFVLERTGNSIGFGDDDKIQYIGHAIAGASFQRDEWAHSAGFIPEVPGYEWGGYEFSNVNFTVLAPIPLPAGALMLPTALGCLILLRKRRKTLLDRSRPLP